MQGQVTGAIAEHVNDGQPVHDLGGGQLAANRAAAAAISGAVLRIVRDGSGESREAFAARAGVPVAVVAGAEDGTLPAWLAPYEQYRTIEAAVSATYPGLADVFYTAAACDLFLTGLLKGDDEVEDGALAALLDHEYAGLAWSLLTWAVTGVLDGQAGEYLTVSSSAPLLPSKVLSELAGLYVTVLIDGCGCSDSQL